MSLLRPPILADSWQGVGAMADWLDHRHGFDISLTRYPQGWRASFLHRAHGSRRDMAIEKNVSTLEGVAVERLLTVTEAAAVLACSPAAIRKWISQRRLKAVKVGRLTRVRQSALDAFLNQR